jgi:hypothetical protein
MKEILKIAVFATMLLGLPLAGVLVAQLPASRYFEFPPHTLYTDHAPFSWVAFISYGLFIIAAISPFLLRALRRGSPWAAPGSPTSSPFDSAGLRSGRPLDDIPSFGTPSRARAYGHKLWPESRGRFPWWGWGGFLLGLVSWILAWNRFPWFSQWQAHTFTPLWLAYILTVNGLTYRRTGTCLLLRQRLSYLLLFPASAGFWWFFEYLNRFVQNWSYTGAEFGPGEYFLFATLSFSTVLPAITATRELILSFSFWDRTYEHFLPVRISSPRLFASAVLLASGAGLFLLGVYPNHLFALLWISPLLILVSLQGLLKEAHIFSPLPDGDWRFVLASALAALLCGLFWEMWNFYSLAKWVYHVPFVQRFPLFEMPILGYAGYLPFGLECSVVAEMVLKQKVMSQED